MKRGGSFGYDRHITIFSPEGRLFQIEYASRASRPLDSTCIVSKNMDTVCAVIFQKRKKNKSYFHPCFKIFPLNDFMGCIYSGFLGDIQMKIKETIVETINYFQKFNNQISIDYLTKRISDRNQIFTQYAYMRPLGVKTIFMGIDDELGPQLYKSEPSGYCSAYQICVVGEKENLINVHMVKKMKEKLFRSSSYLNLITYLIFILKKAMDIDITVKDIEIIISTKKQFIFRQLTELEIELILSYVD